MDLKALLIDLIKGRGDVAAATAALDRLLAADPGKQNHTARLLQGAHKAGLPDQAYAALSARLQAAARDQPADPDRTMLATDEASVDADATVMATDQDYAAAGDDPVRGADLTGEAPTEVNPTGADDATLVDPVVAEDPTEVNPDLDDATLINAGDDREVTATHPTVDEDATALNPTLDDDATVVQAGDEDATTVNPLADDDDATAVNLPSTADSAGTERSITGATSPTRAPSGPVAGVDREYREGDLLRGRFELISKLGEGGMGAVWKGKDKLKEEARDRNPFVAIKLLQGDFKEHPEAFIALQRETAKQQRLAHPNIATVYDFDRDENTGTVFMTMEVMEGEPMDEFIRHIPADGLPEEEAIPLIEGLCAGLNYAHAAGLVHSDLKPGNAFMVTDPELKHGRVKLLDFGIARASKTKADETGEKTLFDPGQLGALTPTYATVEMFDGQDPDPRDDIYALAIMAYQLFTGKHPYGKKPAPKALELGLKVAPIEKLNKRQNKGLVHGLAFKRDDRTASVTQFLDWIIRKKSRAPLYAAVGLVLAIVIGALGYNPTINYLNERKRDEVIAVLVQPGIANIRAGLEQARGLGPEQLALVLDDKRTRDAVIAQFARGDKQSIDDGLKTIAPFDDKWQQEIRDAPPARKAIVGLFEGRIQNAFDPNNARFDYQRATRLIASLDKLYPDSATVLKIRNDLKGQRDTKLAELRDKYKQLLDGGQIVPIKGSEDISDVIAVVGKIDPKNSLLSDKRLRLRFIDIAQQAVQDKDYTRAKSYLQASVAYAPDDPTLGNLRYQVTSELQRIANQRLVASIEQRLRTALPSFRSLVDFQAVRDDLIKLADLNPTSAVLVQIQNSLKKAFGEALAQDIAAKRWPQGEKLLVDFAKLLEVPYLTEQRTVLAQAETAAGFQLAMTPERQAAVDKRIAEIDALLAKPEFSGDWEIKLKVPYKELVALLPIGDPALQPVRNKTAQLYVGEAQKARSAGRFDEAVALIDKGQLFYPDFAEFGKETRAIADAKEALRKKLEEDKRLARIEAQKADLLSKAEANQPKDAKAILEALRQELPANDKFIAETGPQAVAGAYQRLAKSMTERDPPQYEAALNFARLGLELAPGLKELQDAAKSYGTEVKKRQLEIALRKRFDSDAALDVTSTKQQLAKLRGSFPNRYPALAKEYAESRANRILALAAKADIPVIATRMAEYRKLFTKRATALDTKVAGVVEKRLRAINIATPGGLKTLTKPLAEFARLAPKRHQALAKRLGDSAANTVKRLEKKDKLKALALLDAARRAFPKNPAIGSIRIEQVRKEFSQTARLITAGKLNAATRMLASGKRKYPKHSQIALLERSLKDAKDKAETRYAKYAAQAKKAKHTEQKRFDAMFASIGALWPDRKPGFKRIAIRKPRKGECNASLAGYGSRSKGTCFDLIGRKRGPALVVVPAGGGMAQPFAIGKYEVSGADYSVYCKATKRCKALPRKKSKLPVTGISLKDAEAYAKWLSTQATKSAKTKVVYRLPTDAEWSYAAKAGGKQPTRKYNCRVTSGGKIISGFGLVGARSGKANGWGLTNYVGNAQEWVRSGSGVTARGGAFDDPLTKCGIQMSKPHTGGADPVTGFRLVREMG